MKIYDNISSDIVKCYRISELVTNHNSYAHVIKEDFSTALQLISPKIPWAGRQMVITYAHFYCGLAAPVERAVKYRATMLQGRHGQIGGSVSSPGSSGVRRHMQGKPTCGQRMENRLEDLRVSRNVQQIHALTLLSTMGTNALAMDTLWTSTRIGIFSP